jgi:hypothetical protein
LNKTRFTIAIIVSAYFIYYCLTFKDWHFLDNFNLIIHEAGHIVFMFFGTFVQILGGSLFQILVPVIFVLYFYRQREYFSASLVLFWVGQSLINVSVYASDALYMQLPLLGGDSSIHDWNYILQTTNLLKYSKEIGFGIYSLGILSISVAFCSSIIISLYNKETK